MKFLNKRIISLLLAMVILCGMMPMTAFAAEEAEANLWNGRSAVFVGDSITAGSGTTKIYYEYLEESLGFDSVTPMGVAGSCISAASDYGQSNQPLINRYQDIPSADLIVIFMGTNDYGHETPLGNVGDTQDGTFYGALNMIISALVVKHPSSKIVFVTPLHRYGFGTSKILGTSFTSDDVANGVGATLGDYVDALKTVCVNNGVSVIDLYTECTLDPADTDTRTNYMPDGLHPNAAGHEVIAGIMESHIRGFEPAEQEPIELTEMVYGNRFATGNNQSCRASSRINYYLKAGTVITLKNADVMQWACTKTSDENSSSNLGYFPDSGWSDKETAVVAEDGWIGFTFKYRDETQSFDLTKPLSDYITIEEPHTHTYENGICTGCGATVSPYLQQLPEKIIGCTNLYDSLAPVKGYYTATKYDTSNGNVLSVVIPVEPGDRIAASSFGPVSENMGSVNGIRVTYLLGNEIVSSLSPGDVYSGYTTNGYITVPDGVDAVCVPWWKPSDSNWLTLSQSSKDFAVHIPKTVSAQAPTCTESGYTAGEICEICNVSLGEREEIPATGHSYSGDTCTVCGTVNLLAFLDGKYISILGDSISTFNGYSNDSTVNSTIGGNGPRYDEGTADTKPGSYCLLESVNDTWWMHFSNRNGLKLLVNNSWAGSQVFGGKTSDGRVIPAAYLERCVNLHDNTLDNNPGNAPINPDVIFVYLGINDYNFNRSKVGTGAVDYTGLVNSDGTYVTPETFGEAYGIMLRKMRNAYPDAQIFAMTLLPENLYSVDKTAWEQHNAYIRAAAEYYNIPVVDLATNCAITWENYSDYMIDKIHPTTAGMELISDCIEAELVAYYQENPSHTHTYENGICTVCGAEHPNLANYEGKVISILGGSTCTFDGYIPVADGFNLTHRPRYPQSNLLTDVNDTWWMQVVAELDAKLGINDSWAGSQVLNTLDSNSGDLGPDAAMASLTRIQNLGANGTPNIILFYGAMNDIGRGVSLGSFDAETAPSQADLTATKWSNLADAYVAAILRMQHYYPNAEIVAVLPGPTASYYTEAERKAYCEVLKAICDHYGVPTVDLSTCGLTTDDMPDGTHPNAEGMDYITAAVLDTLLNECQMEADENMVHSVTHELTGAKSSLSYYKGVSDGKSFVTTITGEDVAVTVTMGGIDITNQVYSNGKISISAVTGVIVITAKGKYNADGRLQQLPENYCCDTNLWTTLDPVNEYYTTSGWGNNSNSNYSVTFPVTPGDQIWATSFGAAGTNGYSANAVRITWFDENGVLKSLGRDTVYAEFAKNGYITVPEGATAVNIPMASDADAWEIYILNRAHCYENGICTGCGEAQPGPVITQQPTDGEAKLGERYMVEVLAEGEGLTYQWYGRNAGSKSWFKSSVKDNTYDDVMTNARVGREVYCVITDANGKSVTTDTVKLVLLPSEKLEIVTQPTDDYAVLGEDFCVTVEAKGEGLKYQWYFRNANSDKWYKSGVRDNTYDDVMTRTRAGREIYCVVTDRFGNTVTTDIVKLNRTAVKLEIITQPADETTYFDEMFCATVVAKGDRLRYQWYFRNAGSDTWHKSNVRDNTYDDVMTKARNGREIYCVITDEWGNTVTTDVVKLLAVPRLELKLLGQTYESASMGECFSVTVNARGDGLKYQWYFRNAGTEKWSRSSVKDNTYDDVMNRTRANREVYCVITDVCGNQITTEVITLTVEK